MSSCHYALVGKNTPTGEFQLMHYTTEAPGYGGDLLVFKENEKEVWAIHRVLDIPGQQRLARLYSPYAHHRKDITDGCVNIDPEVYKKLVECCSNSKVIIK
jgi:hypothetical protein